MSLVSEVSMLVDESGGAVWWTAAQVYDAINDTLIEMWGQSRGIAQSTATMTVTASADLVEFPWTSIMIPQAVLNEQLNVPLFSTTHDELENWSRRWRGQPVDKPKWLVQWDAKHFRVFPQSDAQYEFLLWGTPWPAEIGTATQDLVLDPMERKAIVLNAAANLLDLTQPELADAHRTEALGYMQRSRANVRNGLNTNLEHLRPGTGWNVAGFGRISSGRKYR